MKILYVDPVIHSPTSQNYLYYDGVYNELIRREDCKVYHHRGVITDFSNVNHNFDVVIFGLGYFNHKHYQKIDNLNIPSVCILFKPQNDLSKKLSFCKQNNITKILTPVPMCKEFEEQTGISTSLFPYGFCPKTFYNREDITKETDIGFSGALHENKLYPPGSFPVENLRTKIGKKLSSLSGIRIYWKASDDASTARIPSYEDYAKKINSSKMWVATQAAFGDITPRHYEVFGSGTLLVCQKVPTEYESIFIDEENTIQFSNDLSDFEDKISKYLKDQDRFSEIISRARLDSEKHTWSSRANQLVETLESICK